MAGKEARMFRYLILALVLAGCAASASTFTRPRDLYNPSAEYPFYYDALYADLFWRCQTPEGGGVEVEGYAVTSMRSNLAMFRFEMQLLARDAKGNTVADDWSYGNPVDADNITPIAFTLTVPAAGDAVAHDLLYRFQVPDNGNGNGSGTSRGHHEPRVQLVGGLPVFGTIEDACSDRYRRKAIPPGS